jgi:hypothetical protein
MKGSNTLELIFRIHTKLAVYQLIISRRYIFMSRRLQKILCLFLSIIFVFGLSATAYAEENNDLSLQSLSIYSDDRNNGIIDSYINDINSQLPLFKDIVSTDSDSQFIVGNEIVCYNLDIKERVFYYPIYINSKCVLMASRTDSSGISVSNDVRVYDQLAKIKQSNSKYLLNIYDSKLFIENQDEKTLLVDYSKENGKVRDNSEENLDFNQKIDFIENEFSCNLIESDDNEKTLISLQPSIGESYILNSLAADDTSYYLDITDAAVIQLYDDCWAAAAATVINYRNGSSPITIRYTAEMICDEMGIGYNDGGNAYDIQAALAKHKINYSLGNKISYSTVKSRIDYNNPFIMQLINSDSTGGHSLVAMGYLFNFANKAVLFYDPNGFYKAFNYDVATYYINGETHTWEATVY